MIAQRNRSFLENGLLESPFSKKRFLYADRKEIIYCKSLFFILWKFFRNWFLSLWLEKAIEYLKNSWCLCSPWQIQLS